jgi:hypothetical protein
VTESPTELFRQLEKTRLLWARLEPGKIVVKTDDGTLVLKGRLRGPDLYVKGADVSGAGIVDALVWTILEDGRNPARFLQSLDDPAEFFDHGHRGYFPLGALLRYCDERGVESLCDWLVGRDGSQARRELGVEQFPLATGESWLVVLARQLPSLTRDFWTKSAPPKLRNDQYMGAIEALERLLVIIRHPGTRAAALLPGRYPACYFAPFRRFLSPPYEERRDPRWAPGSLAYGLYISSLDTLESVAGILRKGREEACLESPRMIAALCRDVLRELDAHATINTLMKCDLIGPEHLRDERLETISTTLGFEGLEGLRLWLARERSVRSLIIAPGMDDSSPEPVL